MHIFIIVSFDWKGAEGQVLGLEIKFSNFINALSRNSDMVTISVYSALEISEKVGRVTNQ